MHQPRFRRSPSPARFALALCASFLWLPTSHAQTADLLEPGKSITRELSGGTTHAYQVRLTAGQFLRAVVEQRGINVFITLYGPDSQKLADLDSPVGAQGTEPVSLLAATSGVYRVEVRAMQSTAPAGQYDIKIEEVRAATPQDKDRVAAERAFADATLTYQGSGQSRRQGIAKYEKVIPLWQALRDPAQEATTLATIGLLYRQLGEYQQAFDYYTSHGHKLSF